MENKTKKSPLAISLLFLAQLLTAGFGIVLLAITQGEIASASVTTDATETNESISPGSNNNNNTLTLAEKPFLTEHGKTVAVNPINQTHIQISLAGNGTIMLPNSTETVKTKDTGNAVTRLTPTGNIAQGEIHISTRRWE